MTTISLRVNDDESKLIHDYVSVNQLNMSQFIRDESIVYRENFDRLAIWTKLAEFLNDCLVLENQNLCKRT